MNTLPKTRLILAACAALSFPFAASAANISKDEYKATKDKIEAAYKADKSQCDTMNGNAKDVCVEQAKGKEKVAKAENEFNYSGKPADQNKIAMAKADADYAVAKEKCDDQTGDAKNACQKEAKALHTKAVGEVKSAKQMGEAKAERSKS